jgi:glycosyltransferase involved in cell wall biosynthesis
MVMIYHDISKNAHGGSELVSRELDHILRSQQPGLHGDVAIHVSRFEGLVPGRVNILWAHDMATDPMYAHLGEDAGAKFDAMVFVSHWQYREFLNHYQLCARRLAVIPNGLFPLDDAYCDKWRRACLGSQADPIRLIYYTTPHRGLEILLPVYSTLHADLKSKNIHLTLDVYSSFSIYGWPQRDIHYQSLFDFCENHPAIRYHGAVEHSALITALTDKHIFAFPSIWPETFCCSLAEAMAARLLVVHSNLGALAETSGGLTDAYDFVEDRGAHAERFARNLDGAIALCLHGRDHVMARTQVAADRVEHLYAWDRVAPQWVELLESCVNARRASSSSPPMPRTNDPGRR